MHLTNAYTLGELLIFYEQMPFNRHFIKNVYFSNQIWLGAFKA